MPLVCVSIISGWSGQTIYDIYLLQVFNVFFTCFPIVVYSVYDLQYTKQELLSKPILYGKNLTDNFLSWGKYFTTMIEALVLGLFIFLVAYRIFDKSLGYDGRVNDMRLDGALCYKAVVLAVTIKLM